MTGKHNHFLDGFRTRLYWLLMGEDAAVSPSVHDLSDLLGEGFSIDTIYAIVRGERHLRLGDFPRFFIALGRPRKLLDYVVRACDPGLMLVQVPDGTTNGQVTDELMMIDIHKGRLAESFIEAMRDGRLDAEERDVLRAKAISVREDADRMVAELMMKEVEGRR